MRKKIITKDTLLTYAEEIIRQDGLALCTMRSLAQKADIAVGTLYNYYPSRKLLLKDVFNSSWKKTLSKLNELVKTDMPTEKKLKQYFIIMFEEINNRNGLGKEVTRLDADIFLADAPYSDLMEALKLTIKQIIKESDKNKNLSDDTLGMLAKWLLIAIITHVTLPGESDEEFISQACLRFL